MNTTLTGLILALLCFISNNARAQLSGAYTIDPGAAASQSNYKDIGSAISDMVSGTRQDGGTASGKGISGSVVFSVADGIYYEKLSIDAITGLSATNTITFTGKSKNSGKVLVTDSTAASSGDYLLEISNAAYISFEHLSFSRPYKAGNLYGDVIHLDNAHDISFSDLRIIGPNGNDSLQAALISGAHDNDSNITIKNCILRYGSMGVDLQGGSNTAPAGIHIESSTFDSMYRAGIQLLNVANPYIHANRISHLQDSGVAINLNFSKSATISANRIHLPLGETGMYLHGAASSASPALVVNNFVNVGSVRSSLAAGIYLMETKYVDIVNNTINISEYGPGISCVLIDASSGSATAGYNNLYNNVLVSRPGGYSLYFTWAARNSNMVDKEIRNAFKPFRVLYGSDVYWNIINWRNGSSYKYGDKGIQLAKNPLKGPGNLYANIGTINGSKELDGYALPAYAPAVDIDGELRSTTSPDLGADEHSQATNDLTVIRLVAPAALSCVDSSATVALEIGNNGTADQQNFTIYLEVSGATTFSAQYAYSSKLAAGQVDTVYFSSTLNNHKSGDYIFTAWCALAADEENRNDTLVRALAFEARPKPLQPKDTAICGPQPFSIAIPHLEKYQSYWYSQPAGGISSIGVGDTLKIGHLKRSDTFYVSRERQDTILMGPDNYQNLGGSYYADVLFNKGIVFYAKADVTLESIQVFLKSTGDVHIQVIDSADNYLYNNYKSFNSGRREYPLGLKLKAGNAYTVKLGGFTDRDLYYNDDLPSNLIYNSEVGTLRSWGNHTWSFFYNWKFTRTGCLTEPVPVRVTVNTVPSGAELVKGSTYQGTWRNGTMNDPDKVCAQSTLEYALTPPANYSNADYGNTWEIDWSVTSASGDTMSGVTYKSAGSSQNLSISLTPSKLWSDSLLKIGITVRNIQTGCDSSFSRYVKVIPLPKADFTASNACEGDAVKINFTGDQGTGLGIFKYYFGDGDSSASASPVHTYATPGTYKVTLYLKNVSGCTDSISKTLEVFPKVEANILTAKACINIPATIKDSTLISGGTIVKRKWYFGDGDTLTADMPVHTYTKAGVYNLSLVAHSSKGCSDSTSRKIIVYDKPQTDFTYASVCPGEPTDFSNKYHNSSNTYYWDFGDGNTATGEKPQHVFSKGGEYMVELRIVNGNGCEDSISKKVFIPFAPKADFTFSSACENRSISFADASQVDSGKIVKWEWDFGDGTFSAAEIPLKSYSVAGIYKIKLKITTDKGCEDTVSKSLEVLPQPEVAIKYTNVCLGDQTQFKDQSTSQGGAIKQWRWNFGDGDSSSDQDPIHIYNKSGSYWVKLYVQASTGCGAKDSQLVTIHEPPAVSISKSISEKQVVFTVSDSSHTSYQWNFGDGVTSGQPNPVHVYNSDGKYNIRLTVTSTEGCTFEILDTVSIHTSGIGEHSTAVEWQVYPDPFRDQFTVNYSMERSGQVRLELFDISGKRVAMKTTLQREGNYSIVIDGNDYGLRNGIYLLQITMDGKTGVKRIIRMK